MTLGGTANVGNGGAFYEKDAIKNIASDANIEKHPLKEKIYSKRTISFPLIISFNRFYCGRRQI